jgi:hypothetical protein
VGTRPEPGRRSHDPIGEPVRRDAHEDPLTRRPRHPCALPERSRFRIDPIRGSPEGEFAKSGQVAGLEEPVQRGVDPFRDVDLAIAKPLT